MAAPGRSATIAGMSLDPSLPLDGQRILELAARSMFDLFANASEGMLLVDREARVVWINDQISPSGTPRRAIVKVGRSDAAVPAHLR